MERIGLGSPGWSDLRRRPPKTIHRWQASLIRNWCSAPSRISRCITARRCFFVKWRKCRIRRLRKYWRSRQRTLCRACPECGSTFASHSLALPDYVAWTLANSHSFGTD